MKLSLAKTQLNVLRSAISGNGTPGSDQSAAHLTKELEEKQAGLVQLQEVSDSLDKEFYPNIEPNRTYLHQFTMEMASEAVAQWSPEVLAELATRFVDSECDNFQEILGAIASTTSETVADMEATTGLGSQTDTSPTPRLRCGCGEHIGESMQDVCDDAKSKLGSK